MLSMVDDDSVVRWLFSDSVLAVVRWFDVSVVELDSLDAVLAMTVLAVTVWLRCAIAEVEVGEAMVAIVGEGAEASAMVDGDDAIDAGVCLICT